MGTAEEPSSPAQGNNPEPFDIVSIRRKRLQQVIDGQYGGKQSKLVEAIEINAGKLYGLPRSKAFGEKKARSLEVSLGLPRGYLDGQDRLSEAEALSFLNDHAELLEAWGYLLPVEKETIMEQIRHMAAHNKAVLERYKDKP
ncbi:MAG: hypothetical protein ABS89_07650 [Thiobacillus sp. SCN 63-1177]|nr:MAG: hypothetical protein ABS89_07650 [Thiobacillus sp. SCN 63-1177]